MEESSGLYSQFFSFSHRKGQHHWWCYATSLISVAP